MFKKVQMSFVLVSMLLVSVVTGFVQGSTDISVSAQESLEAIKRSPEEAVLLYNKGVALEQSGKHKKALDLYDESIRLDPNCSEAWADRGLVLFRLGRYKEALKSYNESIRLDPQNAKAWSDKGVVLLVLERFNK